jgi:hypothetical protein
MINEDVLKRLKRDETISFLLRRKYPAYKLLAAKNNANPGSVSQKVLSEGAAYEAELRALSLTDLEELRRSEEIKSAAAERSRAEAHEQQLFFNKPSAEVDVEHWAAMAMWSLEEAIPLTFGKDPNVVQWESISAFTRTSPFAVAFERRRQIVLRAKAAQVLSDPTSPGAFITWAKRNNIPFPAELETKLSTRGEFIGDWQTLYDRLKEGFDELNRRHADLLKSHKELIASRSELIEIAKDKSEMIATLQADRAALEERMSTLQAARQESEPKELKTRERDSALKLIIGMAVEVYRYNPKANRNEATREIAADLEKVGVPLDQDTVRKWLTEAKDLLPPKYE